MRPFASPAQPFTAPAVANADSIREHSCSPTSHGAHKGSSLNMPTRSKSAIAKTESKQHSSQIQAPKGKLGVMIPGMGAVATTFVAGVEAIRKGIAKPIGSLTQMGTIRLGKRTDARSPKVKEFVPLANLNDLVFTGWDIFEDNMYAAASNAGVLERDLLEQIKPFLTSITPRKAF